jgi:hypothetical protein
MAESGSGTNGTRGRRRLPRGWHVSDLRRQGRGELASAARETVYRRRGAAPSSSRGNGAWRPPRRHGAGSSQLLSTAAATPRAGSAPEAATPHRPAIRDAGLPSSPTAAPPAPSSAFERADGAARPPRRGGRTRRAFKMTTA